jgi:hypothetical protein
MLNYFTAKVAPVVAAVFTMVFLLWHVWPWYLDVAMLVIVLLAVGLEKKRIPSVVNVTAAFSFILAIGIVISSVMGLITNTNKSDSQTSGGPYIIKPGQSNIYFIVPDRMPSPEAMRESGINPDQMLVDLRALGFYINETQSSLDPYTLSLAKSIFEKTTEIRTYTTRTMRYFASVLNGGVEIPLSIPYQECRTLIKDNALFTWLHGKGYSIVNNPSWFTETAFFTDQDEVNPFTEVSLLERLFQNELGEAYFSRTILNGLNFRGLESFGSQQDVEKSRLAHQALILLDIAGKGPDSKFVITHLTLPHEPYVYGNPNDSIPDQYYANIRAAMQYLTDLASDIRTLDPTATIIIQSDEGMAYRKPADLNWGLSPVQWSGVFTAWYLPDLRDKDKEYLDSIKHTEILDIVLTNK